MRAVYFLPLLLLLSPCVEAGRRKHKRRCPDSEPICKSDRFDVVFSHYDDYHCKVYKCQCRIPDTTTCPQGRPQVKTDSHGCQYYECVSCPAQPACTGTQVSVFKGDDANGCPIYACQCPPSPTRPVCNSNEELQQLVDSSGCPYFQCRQVRAQCPDKPECSSNQELVSAGVVGDCEIYRCECLTPKKPACSVGSQPRLQDDGLGCQEYRCVENRSPCPPEPDCPSQYQVVAQDGVDANNCVKYVCRCIPLAPIACPDGYRMELATDEACGCQYYKCEPNCEPKPNCPSVYEHAVVAATRSNGCPSYSCVCREPEVISCAAADAHLTLTKATDGSNCDIYVCHTGNGDRSGCVQPACANPIATGQLDARGCPIYNCGGGNRNPCVGVPSCGVGQQAVQVGYATRSCPQYQCQPSFCQQPDSCSFNQVASVSSDSRGCLVVTCTGGGNRNCDTMPVCTGGTQPQAVGTDAFGCTQYVCVRSGCPVPRMACGVNQEMIISGYDSSGCPTYSCSGSGNRNGNCPMQPACGAGESLLYVGEDSTGCPEYVCHRPGCQQPPTCTVGERLVSTGFSADGCRQYFCQSSTRSCPARPNCGLGQQPSVIGYDGNSCPIYSCPGSNRNCPPPSCAIGQSAVSVGLDGLGCEQFVCQGGIATGGVRGGMVTGGMVTGGMVTGGMVTGGMVTGGMVTGGMVTGGVRGGMVTGYGYGYYGVGGVRNAGVGIAGGAGCPEQPECQYHEFRMRSVQQLAGGQVCTVYNCISLGDYRGKPRKCLDNPSHCEDTQTVETYVKRRNKHKACQKVVCKGTANVAYY